MKYRRLGWAGVELECGGETLVIDYVQDKTPLAPVLRRSDEPFPEASNLGNSTGALLTHLHADHADADAIAQAIRHGGLVLRPEAVGGTDADRELSAFGEAKFAGKELSVQIVGNWTDRNIGPFRMSTVPAVDGFGDPQVSWVVECDKWRIIHAGDTLFHGAWWKIANHFEEFDIAFLPINAPVCVWPHLQPPSPLEAVMNPEQAVVAASILRAKRIVPIHYGSLNKSGVYTETAHPVERLLAIAGEYHLQVQILEPGVWAELAGD